jgi:hypothetical protein
MIYQSDSQFKIVELSSGFTSRLILENETHAIEFTIPLYVYVKSLFNGIELFRVSEFERLRILENVPYPLLTEGYSAYSIVSEGREYFVVCQRVEVVVM